MSQSNDNQDNEVIRVSDVKPLTPTTKAVLAAGEKLIADSVETGRDFCKLMINTNLVAIPAYVALVSLFIDEEVTLGQEIGVWWLLPVLSFGIAIFAGLWGFIPGMSRMSLEIPEDVESTIKSSVRRRYLFGGVSFAVFVFGGLTSIIVLAKLA